MQVHGALYKRLKPQRRAKYERAGCAEVIKRAQEIAEDGQHSRSAQVMTLGRLSAERHAQACLVKTSNCRLGDEDMELLLVMYEDDKYKTRTGLREMRAKAITPPEHPADAVKVQLESVELMSAPASDQPAWVSTVCLHRDHFADCALVVESPAGGQLEVFA